MTESLYALLPQIILFGTALIVLFLKVVSRTMARQSDSVGLIGALLALGSLVYVPGGREVSGFVVDQFSLLGTGLLVGTLALVLVYSRGFLRKRNLPRTEWTFLLISATLGLSLMLSTYHLLMLFIGLEISSLGFYVLCGYLRDDKKSIEAALKYFILGSIGSAVLLLGIALVFVNQESIVVTAFAAGTTRAVGFSLSFAVVILGLLFKLSIIPLHFWVPDVYEGAPTPVTAFMSVAVKIGVLGSLVRMYAHLSGGVGVDWSMLFWWGAVVTILGGNLLALVQENLKRMLAYSSIAHAGYLMLGLVTLGSSGYTAVLFYLLIYLFMNVLAFGVISMLDKDGDTYFYSDLRGLSQSSPLLAAALAVAMISLTGLPPTAGFMGKLFLFYGVVQAGYPLLAVIAVIGSVISVAYYFEVIVYSYMRDPEKDAGFVGLNLGGLSRLTAALSVVLILYLGLNPAEVYHQIRMIVEIL